MKEEIVKPLQQKIKGKKKENLKQRAYLNSLTGLIDYGTMQLTGFIVSPFLVNGLGSSMYGIWQMLGQMTGYAKVADTRATQVLKWTVAKKKDVADEDELRSDVSSALLITLFIVPLILIGGGIIAWYAPYITKAEPEYFNLIRITCSLLILSLVVSKLFDLYESVLRGMNLAFKRMGLRAAIVAIGGGLKVLVITQGFGLIGLSIVHVVISLVIGITYYIVVKRTVPWFGLGKTNFKKVINFSKVSGWYLADTGANVLLSSSDKILLGFVASPVIVTYYTLTLFLPIAIQGLVNRVVLGVIPGIGKLLGLGEYDRINKALNNIKSITHLLITASGVTIIIFNSSFLFAWVGEGYYSGDVANFLIVVMVSQDTFIKHDAYIISATLDLKRKVFLTLIAGVMFILVGFFLTPKLEIAGLCLSLILGKFLLFIGQRQILLKKIPVNSHSAIRSQDKLRSIFVSLSLLGIAAYISGYLKIFSILEMTVLAPLSFAMTLLLYLFVGLNRYSRKELFNIVSSIKVFKSD